MKLNKIIFAAKSNGLNIETVYDIGACTGSWSMNMRYSLLPNAKFYLFEANPDYEKDLQGRNMPYFMTVLSNPERGEVEFYNGKNTGDSYYKETTKIYDEMSCIKLKTQTLDNLIQEHNLPTPQFIKLDTQGSELDILDGAKTILGKTEFILTEMPIVEYNKGAPKFSDYVDAMRVNDYVPIDIIDIIRAEDTLLQVDVLFMLKSAKEKFLGVYDVIRV
jgi:FkbM family methyltransferase